MTTNQQLIHIKLNSGEDIIGYGGLTQDRKQAKITNPISIHMDPVHGFFAKNWLLLSTEDTAIIPAQKILTVGLASDTAKSYYDSFLTRMSDDDTQDDELSELADILNALKESKGTLKH